MSKTPETACLCTEQLELPFLRDAFLLQSSLRTLTGTDLAVTLTDNRRSMLSIRKRRDSLDVRIHRIFLEAEDHVLQAVADFIRGRKTVRSAIQTYVKQKIGSLQTARPNPALIKTEGACYCLQPIFDAINAEYFGGAVTASITWGRSPLRRRTRRVTLGSYCETSHTIRINPLLDRRNVPAYFLHFVIYHEMLHAVVGTTKQNGRRTVHSREFREREKQFREYERAVSWEKQKIFR